MIEALAFDIPGMRKLNWLKAMEVPQAVVQFSDPDDAQIEALKTHFGLHDLQIKDICNPQHPACRHRLAKGTLLILRMPRFHGEKLGLVSVSLLFDTKLCAIVWPDTDELLLERRHLGGANINETICHAVHTLTERTFQQLWPMLETVDELEDDSFADIERADMASLLGIRQNLVVLARGARGNFQALDPLQGNGALAGNQYLNDACEHMQRTAFRAESTAEHLLAVMQAIQSLLGQRMNETIKVLTIITVTLSPLAVITGIFGMNFEHMPILRWPWGFAASLLLMSFVAGILAIVFKRKRWW